MTKPQKPSRQKRKKTPRLPQFLHEYARQIGVSLNEVSLIERTARPSSPTFH